MIHKYNLLIIIKKLPKYLFTSICNKAVNKLRLIEWICSGDDNLSCMGVFITFIQFMGWFYKNKYFFNIFFFIKIKKKHFFSCHILHGYWNNPNFLLPWYFFFAITCFIYEDLSTIIIMYLFNDLRDLPNQNQQLDELLTNI